MCWVDLLELVGNLESSCCKGLVFIASFSFYFWTLSKTIGTNPVSPESDLDILPVQSPDGFQSSLGKLIVAKPVQGVRRLTGKPYIPQMNSYRMAQM